jgi:hypothetical protein
MRLRRVRFTIQNLMLVVLAAAILMAMSTTELVIFLASTTILAVMFRCACRLALIGVR